MKTGVYTRNGEDFNFEFKTSLSANEKVAFVNLVTDLLVEKNYNYVIKDMIFDFMTVCIFTNDIDVSYILSDECSDDEFYNEIENLLEETNIIDIIVANSEDGLIDDLKQAVDYNVEYKTGIHRNVISESIADLIKTIEKKVGDFTIDSDSIMGMMNMLNGISDELTMDNLLDAYARSDMYKKQHDETVKKHENHNAKINEIIELSKRENVITPILSSEFEV